MSTVGRWIRIDLFEARAVTRYRTRRRATSRLKACRPVPCPPLMAARLHLTPIPPELSRFFVDVHLPPEIP